jgi:CCR4-NOT transcription complex subunit 7/8
MSKPKPISEGERLSTLVNASPRPTNADNILNKTPADGDHMIIDVWAHNLQEELDKIVEMVAEMTESDDCDNEYCFIAMDTEFPGVVARPLGCFKSPHDYHYQTLKCNVDLLKIIQLGLCFCDKDGNVRPGVCTWQFNFKFDLSKDMYAQDSIELLTKSGIDFKAHEARGIDVSDFGEILMTSGIVLSDEVKWISFHSGYDYGYLLKVLTCEALPREEAKFFELLTTYFPYIYDIKYMMKSCRSLTGGLANIANLLQVPRIGPQHQAGSDSLLTASTFFKMRQVFFDDVIDDEEYSGVLYGLQNLKRTGIGKEPT